MMSLLSVSHVFVVAGVDETTVVNMKFSKGRMAVFTCSSGMQLPNEAIIVGTKGTIRVGLRAGLQDQIKFK